jgi:hypothetical protein
MDKKSTSVHAVNEESDNDQADQQDVAAFRPHQMQQNRGFQSNSNRGNNRSRAAEQQVQLQWTLAELQPEQPAQV